MARHLNKQRNLLNSQVENARLALNNDPKNYRAAMTLDSARNKRADFLYKSKLSAKSALEDAKWVSEDNKKMAEKIRKQQAESKLLDAEEAARKAKRAQASAVNNSVKKTKGMGNIGKFALGGAAVLGGSMLAYNHFKNKKKEQK